MVLTRSNHGKEKNESTAVTSDTGTGETSGTTGTEETRTTGNTTFTDATATTPTDTTTPATSVSHTGGPADTSGIKATPAASTATVIERHSTELMPPPAARTLKPARSRRSGTSSKRLLAELGARERLAELELRRIRAEAELEKIRQQRSEAESTSSEEEADDLAPQRISDWFDGQPEAKEQLPPVEDNVNATTAYQHAVIEKPLVPENRRELAARIRKQQKPRDAQPPPVTAIDVTSLTAALTEAIHGSKSSRRYIPDLPDFNGHSQDWLQFRAAYNESAASFTASENVARIRKSLRGVAQEAVSALLISQPRPEDLISSLERRFGRPDALLIGEIEKMKNLPRLSENPRDLCVFASRVANTVTTIQILKRPQYLHNPEVLRLIIEKMTPILRNKWYDYAAENEDTPELKRIADFLNGEADRCAPYAPPELPYEKEKIRKKIERAYAVTTEEKAAASPKTNTTEKASCPHCNEDHKLPACPRFNKADINERWEIAKKTQACFRCLISKHRRFACKAKPCGLNGCTMRHHRLLHHEKAPPVTATTQPSSPPPNKTDLVVAAASGQVPTDASRAYLKITPVTLRGPQATVQAYALLDEGSTVTIIDSSLADTLGLDGPHEPMWVQGVSGTEIAHNQSKKVNVNIRGRHSGDELHIRNARTVANLDFTTQSINEREVQDCQHLEDIKHELLYVNATPKILIGQDNWELIVSREIRKGRRDQLVASKTLLGWVLHGCRSSHAAPVAFCCAHLSQPERADSMEEMMKKYFALESLSIEPRKPSSDPELQALKILNEKSRRLPDGRFETGLLWREENQNVPDNRPDALKRLHTLERKLDRDEDLKKKYEERMNNLLTSNYAERTTAPPSGRAWYLPHFAVCNPEKQKIRVVHDAAATSHGRSLNDMLLPGPDLLQSLPGVIMRFRQHGIAVSADIKEMFMQIKIREEDRDALRFLWRGNRREGAPEEYRMTSVIFGASSSPCTALYIKNRNASEHAAEYPQAATAIKKNHYMDDYLQSFPTVNEAKQVTKDVDYVHKQAGFELRGWATNEQEAISNVAECTEREGTTVAIGGSEIEKTLGLLWDTKEDCIRFRLNVRKAPPEVLEDLRPPTKREALSIIMSIFDPLGLISPVTTPAKRLMQDTWRYKTDWDETIPEELQKKWSEWLRQLHDLGRYNIPRCYDVEPAARYELHTFVDASEEAYAAAIYWRITQANGSIKVALAAAKSRVTPNKPISVPRLELQAAVLGVRLAKTVAEEHDYEIAKKNFWSDSRTALTWIRAEPRTYKTFVAHRLAEIEDHSRKNEWRWLPSADNVADDATRATPIDFDPQHRWFNGPRFLYQTESTWPRENKIEVPATGEEKEKCNALQEKPEHAHLPPIERFSKWTRLLRATARALQFIDLCRRKVDDRKKHTVAAAKRKRTRANPEQDGTWNEPAPRNRRPDKLTTEPTGKNNFVFLEADYLITAERLWVRASQEDSYRNEITRLRNNRTPDKNDRLAALSVYIDEDGIIRLRSRIAAADDIHAETARPAVLHGKHTYAKLYIAHVHEKLHHGGTEIVVNELRQRVYIAKIRPAVKEVIARCAICRLKRAKPAVPPTGDLPAARLAHHVRPFSYTGLDYFGPLEVTVGRHREKRYVALFTCMTSRAVHLEVAASLSTDSAISALRRFIARRGCPTELWSDNATAFRGADRELTEAIKEEAAARRINWRFLPPAAPFMAGVWERMVRTVKEALRVTLHERYPSDETLQTLLAEVETTVNSRPLTHVAVTPDDPPALTPNMILIGPDSHAPAPGTFSERDVNARQHWRRAQQLADTFWRRWVREYMPLLQNRREPLGTGVSPAVGDVVVICDSNLPRNTWPRGRITKIYPGKDGVVRVVDVTTSKGHVLRRPTKKIVVLPVGSQGDGGRMCTTE